MVGEDYGVAGRLSVNIPCFPEFVESAQVLSGEEEFS